MNENAITTEPPDRLFKVQINDETVEIADATPSGNQLLTAGRFEPADDYVLVEKTDAGSRLISLDETIHLAAHGTTSLFAFKSGEVFLFTVNTHGYQWGQSQISDPEIRDLADIRADDVLVLGRDDDDEVIAPGSVVSLRHGGTEHFRTETRLIKVFIDNVEKEIPRGTYTTEQLINVLGVTPGYLLNLQRKSGLDPLKPGEPLKVKAGMRFFSQAPGGGSA